MVGRYNRPTGFELPNAALSPWLLTAANSLWATKCCPQVRLYCPDPAVCWNCTALQVNKSLSVGKSSAEIQNEVNFQTVVYFPMAFTVHNTLLLLFTQMGILLVKNVCPNLKPKVT